MKLNKTKKEINQKKNFLLLFFCSTNKFKLSVFAIIFFVGIGVMLIPVNSIVNANGKVINIGEIYQVKSNYYGTVDDIFVKNGTIVARGEKILDYVVDFKKNKTLISPEQQRDKLFTLKTQYARFDSQSRGSNIIFPEAQSLKQKKNIEKQLNIYNRNNKYIETLQKKLKRKYTLLQQKIDVLKKIKDKQYDKYLEQVILLYREGIFGVKELIAINNEIVKEKVNKLANQTVYDKSDIISLKQKIKNKNLFIIKNANLNKKKLIKSINHLENITKSIGNNMVGRRIVSPIVGTISNLQINKIGVSLDKGQIIADIIPADNGIEFHALVKPEDKLVIKSGQKVQLQFVKFSMSEYIGVGGIVKEVLPDMTKKGFYCVIIELEQNHIQHSNNKKQILIVPDMKADVFIFADNGTLIQYLIMTTKYYLGIN